MRFGNPECDICGHVHPSGFDCVAAAKEDDMGLKNLVDKLITDAGAVPPVDRSARILTDGSPETPDHREIQPNGMQKGYIVLTEAERSRGFVRPVRRTYVHEKCGVATKMGTALAETYARDPEFYSGTFCCGCGTHFPVGADGEFVWDDGSKVGT